MYVCQHAYLFDQVLRSTPGLSSNSAQTEQPHSPLPEFIQGSSGSAPHAPQPDLDSLASRLQASASFNDDDNMWNKDEGDGWAF